MLKPGNGLNEAALAVPRPTTEYNAPYIKISSQFSDFSENGIKLVART